MATRIGKKRNPGFVLPILAGEYKAIGRVAAQWAYFEVRFDEHLNLLRSISPDQSLATNQPSYFQKRAELVEALARTIYPDKDLKPLLSLLQ